MQPSVHKTSATLSSQGAERVLTCTSGRFRSFQWGGASHQGQQSWLLGWSGGMFPQENVYASEVDFEASGTYFGTIDTSLVNDAMSLCSKGVGLTTNLWCALFEESQA